MVGPAGFQFSQRQNEAKAGSDSLSGAHGWTESKVATST